uniref:Uncharacterized protein n=1 Tax=Oryza brachyantha TaxID=4533 RepID=J3N5M1_ORYBR
MAKNPHVSISLTGLAMAVFLFSSSLQAAQGGAEKKKEVSEYYYDVPVRRLVYRPAGGGDEHGGSVLQRLLRLDAYAQGSKKRRLFVFDGFQHD